MGRKPKEPDILSTAKRIATMLAKSGLDFNRQNQALSVAVKVVADAEYQAYKAPEVAG
jgi:hypothetical protein